MHVGLGFKHSLNLSTLLESRPFGGRPKPWSDDVVKITDSTPHLLYVLSGVIHAAGAPLSGLAYSGVGGPPELRILLQTGN
jgi:hypothetical protein